MQDVSLVFNSALCYEVAPVRRLRFRPARLPHLDCRDSSPNRRGVTTKPEARANIIARAVFIVVGRLFCSGKAGSIKRSIDFRTLPILALGGNLCSRHDVTALQTGPMMVRKYFFGRMDVFASGSREPTGRRLMIEIEVGAAAIDAEIHAVRNAALTAADQYTRNQFDTQVEYLGDCKFIPTNMIPRTWGMPVDTSIEGVKIWGVTMLGQ
jgi:hypothetical protein